MSSGDLPEDQPFSWELKNRDFVFLHLMRVTEGADDNWGRKQTSQTQTSKVWLQLSARGENSRWDSNTLWNNQSLRTVMWNTEQTCSEWLQEAKLRLKGRSYWQTDFSTKWKRSVGTVQGADQGTREEEHFHLGYTPPSYGYCRADSSTRWAR